MCPGGVSADTGKASQLRGWCHTLLMTGEVRGRWPGATVRFRR
jgi:hypothetical protein